MARMPGARWVGPEGTPHDMLNPTSIDWHSDATGGNRPHPGNGAEWHFWVAYDGTIFQCNDTNTRCDAQFSGNAYCISVETASNRDATDPWTPAQFASMRDIALWAQQVHGIPLTQDTSWNGSGQGYHSMFHQWNLDNHTCPGPTRIAQWPAFLASLGAFSTPTKKEDTMQDFLVRVEGTDAVWLTDTKTKRHVEPDELDDLRFFHGDVHVIQPDHAAWLAHAHDVATPPPPAPVPATPAGSIAPTNFTGSISLTGPVILSPVNR